MLAAIYTRVSTEEQRKHGISLDAQLDRCEQYAASMDLLVVHTGIEAQTAKDTDRPELQTILAMVAKKQIQHLLIIKLDRLSRETEDALRIAKALCKKGVKIHLVTEGGEVDFSDPNQEMMFTMRAAMATFERKRIAMNTKFALARKRNINGRISRHAPYGYEFDGDVVVKNPEEQAVIFKIRKLHDQGYSERKIIAKLESEGILNRAGNPFTRGTIRTITAPLAA